MNIKGYTLTVGKGIRLVFLLFALFHLSTILINASVSAYHSYHSFYDKPKDSRLVKDLAKWTHKPWVKEYGKFSGAECGYGFFAPNVRASSQLVIEGCGKQVTPEFSTHEGRLRYEGFLGDMINSLDTDELKKDKDKIEDVLKEYDKLLLKNVSLRTIKEHQMKCKMYMIRYNVLDFPSKKEAVETGETELRVFPAKSFLIFKTN